MSEKLISALNKVNSMKAITLGAVADHLEKEAIVILCIVAILPFMQPIPIPGLSSLLGFIVVLQGVGLIVLGKPILTERLKNVVISHEKFSVIFKAASKFSKFTSKISTFKHPIVNSRTNQIIAGISIIISSVFLSLPLPIPFSNFVPALSIFLVCIGLLEEDLFLVLMGYGITFAVVWMATFSYQFIMEQVQNWF